MMPKMAAPRNRKSVLALPLLILIAPYPVEAQSFRVSQIKVCSSYSNGACAEIAPPYENLDRNRFPNGRIYFALTLACEKNATDFLTANDFLPVNAAIWKNGARKQDIPIGISQEHWEAQGAALSALASVQGGFPWRTNFYLQIAKVRSIGIEISLSDGATALTGDLPARLNLTFGN